MLGCPRVTEKSWQEGFRRYLFAMDTAQSTASYFSKISSSSLAQRLDVPCALSTLSPHLCISILCGGINSPMLTCSPLLLVPGRNTKAFNCLLNRNDAEGMATVERWLDGESAIARPEKTTEEDAQSQSELRRALRPIIHAKGNAFFLQVQINWMKTLFLICILTRYHDTGRYRAYQQPAIILFKKQVSNRLYLVLQSNWGGLLLSFGLYRKLYPACCNALNIVFM